MKAIEAIICAILLFDYHSEWVLARLDSSFQIAGPCALSRRRRVLRAISTTVSDLFQATKRVGQLLAMIVTLGAPSLGAMSMPFVKLIQGKAGTPNAA